MGKCLCKPGFVERMQTKHKFPSVTGLTVISIGVSLIERSDTLYKDIPPSLISNPHEDHSLSAQEIIGNMNIPYQVMFLDLEVMRYQVKFLEMMRQLLYMSIRITHDMFYPEFHG